MIPHVVIRLASLVLLALSVDVILFLVLNNIVSDDERIAIIGLANVVILYGMMKGRPLRD
jgi:hypothetical protein